MGLRSELHAPRKSRKEKQWDGNISTLRPLGHGVSGMVLAIDENRVVKIDIGSSRSIQDIETEREAYRNLSKGRSPYVLKCFEIDNPNGLVLERCLDTMRKRLRSMPSGFPDRDEIVKEWAYQAAQGLAFLHGHRVIQGDVGCHNMLLDSNNTVKFADFAGSSVNGSTATVDYEVRSKLPNVSEPTEMTDVFALGSAIYEMATGSRPYADKSWREVHGHYKRGQFPKLRTMSEFKRMPELARIIEKCWQQNEYHRAQDVIEDLELINPQYASSDATTSDEDSQHSTIEIVSKSLRRQLPDLYVHQTSNRRPRERAYEFDSEKGEERRRKQKMKKHHQKTISDWLTRSFSWPQSSHTSRSSTYY